MDAKNIREEYNQKELLIEQLDANPLDELKKWFNEAVTLELPVANACTLATLDADGFPQARVVLTKEITAIGPVFFTSYASAKAQEIENSNKVALTYFWKEIDRQVRLWGTIKKIELKESQEYFLSRPYESQLAALAGPQSTEITRQELLNRFEGLKSDFAEGAVVAPENWGGYEITPVGFEFWQGRPSRLHDRFQYYLADNTWKIRQLAP
jgi:pyridoxamine 5'-phosphate oxidase